jgi:CBS domain-containing protein
MTTLKKLKARDIMQQEVTCLTPDTTIESAVETLSGMHISGVPVVDGARKLLGMFSTSDITQPEHVNSDRIDQAPGDWSMGDPEQDDAEEVYYDKDAFSPEVFGPRTVGDWMHRGVVSVGPDASVQRVCRTLIDNGIHRVCVVERGELVGLISSTDVVRCVAENL